MVRLAYLACLHGVLKRDGMRFYQQRSRFLSALVRPCSWCWSLRVVSAQRGVSIIGALCHLYHLRKPTFSHWAVLHVCIVHMACRHRLSMGLRPRMGSMRDW